eukprot:jgi/Tetstr1/443930/TSEL_031882.t1
MAETVNLGSSQQRGGVSARGGSNHNAERPVQLPYPQGPVVGRGIGISPEERWCTPCRGLHDPAKVNNPNWQPYSIRKRMYGLNLLQTQFLGAAQTGTLPVKLDGNNPRKIKWFHCNANGDVLAPSTMTEEEYKWFLPLMLDGCREQHEPHRYLAFQAAKEMIDAAGARLLPCVPYVIRPISIGLQTMEPSLVGVQIFLLQRMLKANQWMGKALAPYYHKMLPLMNLFKHRHDLKIMVPPPRCTPATGTRTGHEAAKDRKGRVCNIQNYVTHAIRGDLKFFPTGTKVLGRGSGGAICNPIEKKNLRRLLWVMVEAGLTKEQKINLSHAEPNPSPKAKPDPKPAAPAAKPKLKPKADRKSAAPKAK